MMSDFSIETSLFRLLRCEFLDIIRILFWLLSAALGPAGQGAWAAGAGALPKAVFVPDGSRVHTTTCWCRSFSQTENIYRRHSARPCPIIHSATQR